MKKETIKSQFDKLESLTEAAAASQITFQLPPISTLLDAQLRICKKIRILLNQGED